ncbi:GAF domain-containing sensor histidine kinase [Nostoc sp. 'Peltigera membranacea cyanobiont' 213]|uniref:GAF domain-containing sensor histidine kinase n=1 Tax=Nostoc sp. 'Peltigera membranacea cyanobiont' 213 TaxID=2014530 RepID=UPI001CB94B4A|nr:GAF domain-containing protein [Nostoc sp. 'Peltigera membranacea cyanobiont' 213]
MKIPDLLLDSMLSCTTMPCTNELTRLKAVYQFQGLDAVPNRALDDLTALAADLCQTPMALVSFIGADRQLVKSKVGITLTEIRRDFAFCNYTIRQSDVFVIPDTLADPRFATNPFVINAPNIRFYAGVPVVITGGCALGTLCVMDIEPRDLSQKQRKGLQTLSHQVIAQLELKRNTTKLRQTIPEIKQLKQQLITQQLVGQQDSILFNLANQIRNSLDLDTILQTAVNEIHTLLQVDRCDFVWCLPNKDRFKFMVTHEATNPEIQMALGELSLGPGSVLAETILNLDMLRIEDISTTSEALTPEDSVLLHELAVTSMLLLPLRTHSGQLGAIICHHCRGSRQWADSEVRLLKAVTDQVAIALDQAELLAQTRATAFAAQTQATYLGNALSQLQQTQMQLVQQEKMSSLGQLVAGVAHEINNPVNFINGNIAYATNYVRDLLELLDLYQATYPNGTDAIQEKIECIDLDFLMQDLPNLLSSMQMGGERIRQIVLSLRNFSRLDEAEMKPVDIHEGIENTLLILKSRLKLTSAKFEIQVIKAYENLPPVDCYAGQLNQVFMNLLGNAIDALDETPNPIITIQTELISRESGSSDLSQLSHADNVVIRIRDNGSGMTETTQQKLFNPFFTTKPIGKGTGLGLSISYQIVVEKHGGILKCSSELGKGSEFLIQIPVEPLVKNT